MRRRGDGVRAKAGRQREREFASRRRGDGPTACAQKAASANFESCDARRRLREAAAAACAVCPLRARRINAASAQFSKSQTAERWFCVRFCCMCAFASEIGRRRPPDAQRVRSLLKLQTEKLVPCCDLQNPTRIRFSCQILRTHIRKPRFPGSEQVRGSAEQ